jgi:putative hemolysin
MRNSWLYYWFWRVNTELRDITLFHELLNKKNKPYRITFGAPINADALQGNPTEAAEALRLKAMALNPDGASYMAAPTPAASL